MPVCCAASVSQPDEPDAARLTDAPVQLDQRAFVGDRFVLDHFDRVLQLVRDRRDHLIERQLGADRGAHVAEIAGARHPRQRARQARLQDRVHGDVDDHVAGFDAIDERAKRRRARRAFLEHLDDARILRPQARAAVALRRRARMKSTATATRATVSSIRMASSCRSPARHRRRSSKVLQSRSQLRGSTGRLGERFVRESRLLWRVAG